MTMSIQKDLDQLNSDISGWDVKNLKELRDQIRALNIKHYKRSPNKVALVRALASQLRKQNGLVSRISYKMPRSAIFVHKGVSKGHPISNPRKSKPWYSPVVNKNLDELGDIVANGGGNIIINNIDIH